MPQLSIIIPCRNEEDSIARFPQDLFPPLDALGAPYEILAIDDGSTDGTGAALRSLSTRFTRLRLIVHKQARGLAGALVSAIAQARGKWIAVLDADLSFSPRFIANLIERQKDSGADMVSGSPFIRPEDFSEVSAPRRWPSLAANGLYRLSLSRALSSYTPIFRLYRASRLKSIALESRGFEVNAEIAAKALAAGWIIAETPVPLRRRDHGRSKMIARKEIQNHLRLLLKIGLKKTVSGFGAGP
ncbi:MAG: glycosyltransferase family 2 protein [Elusimicrobiota bacterium]